METTANGHFTKIGGKMKRMKRATLIAAQFVGTKEPAVNYQLQSNFRAISEQFQSSFRAVLERFQEDYEGNYTAILK